MPKRIVIKDLDELEKIILKLKKAKISKLL